MRGVAGLVREELGHVHQLGDRAGVLGHRAQSQPDDAHADLRDEREALEPEPHRLQLYDVVLGLRGRRLDASTRERDASPRERHPLELEPPELRRDLGAVVGGGVVQE